MFEGLYLVAIAIEAARIVTQWPQLVQASGLALWAPIVAVAVSLLFLLLASRGRRGWAALVLGGLFLFGLPMAAGVFAPGYDPLTAAVTIAQLALQAIALALLLRPESRDWFASPRSSQEGP
ncbi:MAG: hypothetical protein Q7J32_02990 [Sphingomonadaceae bacterium]|nr:hypothetical protein [Sphingomonadaceae bacterium]